MLLLQPTSSTTTTASNHQYYRSSNSFLVGVLPVPPPSSNSNITSATNSGTSLFNCVSTASTFNNCSSTDLLGWLLSDSTTDATTTTAATTEELNSNDIRTLQRTVITSIKAMWAESTWSARRNLMRRFNEFRQLNNITDIANLDWAICLFVESTATAATTRLNYSKHLAALYRRMDQRLPITAMHQAALRSTGGLIPQHQAVPAMPAHVNLLLERAVAMGPRLIAAIFLLWKTASRWDDVRNICRTSVVPSGLKDSELIIAWGDRTKTTRGDPFRASSWTVVQHTQSMRQIVETLQQLQNQEDETLIDWSTDEFVKWVQAQDPSTSALTAHSFKRGALSYLVGLAANGAPVDLTLLPVLAKHKTTFDFPSITIRYLAETADTARILRTQDLTKFLPCDLPGEPPWQPVELQQPVQQQQQHQEFFHYDHPSPLIDREPSPLVAAAVAVIPSPSLSLDSDRPLLVQVQAQQQQRQLRQQRVQLQNQRRAVTPQPRRQQQRVPPQQRRAATPGVSIYQRVKFRRLQQAANFGAAAARKHTTR